MKKTITAVIQARLGSTRLPGKTMMMLEGATLLGHLVARVKASKYVNDIVIATTVKPADDEIERFARDNNLKCYRGSEDDVLDRFYQAGVEFGVETVVRVTPDCPLLDPAVVDMVVSKYLEGSFDYVCNNLVPTFPDGLDTEVFSFKALTRAWNEAVLGSEREHVTPYIRNHPELFRLFNVKREGEDLSRMRWTVDTQRDFEFVKEIMLNVKAYGGVFYSNDVVALLKARPELMDINSGIARDEGYLKSLRKDKA